MFVLQSRSSRYNIHRERVKSKDLKSHATELCQVEEAGQIFETRETEMATVQLWKNGRRSEAELYAATLGAYESKGIVSLLKDLGYEMKPVLATDAMAKEHILHRQGIGRLKHIDVAYFWMQDEVRYKRLRVRRVKSEENVADLGTKPLSKAVIAKHCVTLRYVSRTARRSDVLGLRFDPDDRDG